MDRLRDIIDYQALLATIAGYIPQIIAALLILLAFRLVFQATHTPIKRVLERIGLERPVIKLMIDSVYKYLLMIVGFLMAASQLGIDVGALLAGLGVVGIAIGFAAQDSLSNIIAGFIIFLDKPFTVGDWIEVEEHYGKVWEITMRSTRIQTLNHTYVVVPNKTIIDVMMVNHSKYGKTRVEVPVGIAYKESIPAAREAILEQVKGIDRVLETPPAEVVVDELGDSSVNLIVRVWIDDAEHEKATYFATIEACKIALDQAGIQIPFPHLQLFFDDVEERVVEKLATARP